MTLMIRLRQQGRTNSPFYRLVVTESRARRDGKYVEKLGWYNPLKAEDNISIQEERVRYWLDNGAQLSEKAETLVAKVAPQIVVEKRERELAKRAKLRMKRRASRQAAKK